MSIRPTHLVLTAALVALTACTGDPEPADAPASNGAVPSAEGAAPLPQGHPPISQGLPEGHPQIGGTGGGAAAAVPADAEVYRVVESMNSAGYTYARVEREGEEMWAAGPEAPLGEGDSVAIAGAMAMENFRAASLDRTFDRILFVSGWAKR